MQDSTDLSKPRQDDDDCGSGAGDCSESSDDDDDDADADVADAMAAFGLPASFKGKQLSKKHKSEYTFARMHKLGNKDVVVHCDVGHLHTGLRTKCTSIHVSTHASVREL